MYRIFLVEDDETLCTLVKKHLESWGYEVTAAENFLDITGEFIRSEAQLVLLDLKLPGFNGFHWCEAVSYTHLAAYEKKLDFSTAYAKAQEYVKLHIYSPVLDLRKASSFWASLSSGYIFTYS